MSSRKLHFPRLFPLSWRDTAVTLSICACATFLCFGMQKADSSDGFAFPIFMLAVLLVSRLTTGYLYGFLASVLSVIFVNYIFTYPYWSVNFTLTGYPLTFFSFLVASIMTCALTTQVRQHERLRAENEKEKLRANLLRSVSHDIRTPLTSIVGSTSAVLENPGLSSEDQRELLEDVRSEAQWLIRSVENLLSITRMGDPTTAIIKTPEVVEEILAETVQKFRHHFSNVSVSVTAPDDLLIVPMDPILIEQVLFNLLENAVSHGKSTSHLTVAANRQRSYACLSVADNGQGFSKEALPRLFDGTLKHSETASGDGKRNMGLGLSVCLSIVRAHGGFMEAGNLPAGGAEVKFYLPLM